MTHADVRFQESCITILTEITNLHGCSSGSLMLICRTPFLNSTSGVMPPYFVLRGFFALKSKCFGFLYDHQFYQ